MMNKIARFAALPLAGALLFLVAGVALAEKASGKEPFGRLTIDQVKEKIGKSNFFVFDNNSEESYKSGHVPSAKWVKFDDVKASDLPADKTATLVFYCGNEKCMACHEAANAAIQLGYKNVFIMPAGIQGWKKAGKTLES